MSRFRGRHAAIAAALLPMFARAAIAQDVPVRTSQEVVVTATAIPISAEWNGRTVVVLSGADLASLGIRNLSDAMRLAPGVDVRARGPLGAQTDFSIRGATFGQVLVMVDGRRLNDSQSGHHNGDIPATILGVERIEVVPGPGSPVHGADAIGGTINVITSRSNHLATALTFGQHGYIDAQFSALGGRLPKNLGMTAWASRSSGFEEGREFAQGGASLRAALGRGWTIDAPGFAENQHRTNAAEASLRSQRTFADGMGVALCGGGGGDWVRSTNFGDHDYGRVYAFTEVQNTLSKYVLEYARYPAGGSFSLPLGWNLRASGTVDYRHRADGQKYTLVGAKGSYAIRRTETFVDGTNLLNESYREIAGVSMPGRWVMVGISIN